MSVSLDVAGSLKVTLHRLACRRGRCRWAPQPSLSRALRAGQITGIDLGRVSTGKYRVTLAPSARGIVGRTVVKVVKVG